MKRLLQPRPPLYNPEDYAMSLKKWSRRAEESKQPPSIIALSTPQPGEMSLRQFASVTDLLNKLKMDLKLALARYVSFIYVNIHDREQQQRKANPLIVLRRTMFQGLFWITDLVINFLLLISKFTEIEDNKNKIVFSIDSWFCECLSKISCKHCNLSH